MAKNRKDTDPTPITVLEVKHEDDAILVKRVVAGDELAKIDLVKRLRHLVRRRVCYLSPFSDEVEDLIQDVMLQILLAAPNYHADGCMEAWADAIAVRTTLKSLKRIYRRRRVFEFQDSDAEMGSADTEQDAFNKARSLHISALLRQLPHEQSLALVFKLVHGYSLEEVAALMGRRIEVVRYLLRKGRQSMKVLATKDPRLNDLFSRSGR